MSMLARLKVKITAVLALLLSAGALHAQTDGTYIGFSPYSVFGVGQLHQVGTAWNRSMGGVGIAARSNRYINVLNPASMTARSSARSNFRLLAPKVLVVTTRLPASK